MSNKVYDIVTDRIIEQLEKGTVPCKKPWKQLSPYNFKTGKEYRGINTLLLAGTEFKHAGFASFKQIQGLGGKVKKGSKSSIVVFWKILERLLRYYRVFNLDQTEGLDKKYFEREADRDNDEIIEAEEVIKRNNPTIKMADHAFYNPMNDYIGRKGTKSGRLYPRQWGRG